MVLPAYFVKDGLGSNVSTCARPAVGMNRWMTRFALGANCGGCGARGEAGLPPALASIPPSAISPPSAEQPEAHARAARAGLPAGHREVMGPGLAAGGPSGIASAMRRSAFSFATYRRRRSGVSQTALHCRDQPSQVDRSNGASGSSQSPWKARAFNNANAVRPAARSNFARTVAGEPGRPLSPGRRSTRQSSTDDRSISSRLLDLDVVRPRAVGGLGDELGRPRHILVLVARLSPGSGVDSDPGIRTVARSLCPKSLDRVGEHVQMRGRVHVQTAVAGGDPAA